MLDQQVHGKANYETLASYQEDHEILECTVKVGIWYKKE